MTGLRGVPERWRRLDVTVRDVPVGVLLLVSSFVPWLQSKGTSVGGVPHRPFDALAVVAVLLQSLPLVVRRRVPGVCVTLVLLGFALDQLRGYHTVAGVGLFVALVSTGAHLERLRRTMMLSLTAAYVALEFVFHRVGPGEPTSETVTFYLACVLMWGIGAWLRATRAEEAERRNRVAEDTRTAERARIARELHDVVTHHVTAMVVQAEAARYLTASPDRLEQSLTAVTHTGRRAITDLRHLLDVLNPDHGADSGSGVVRAPAVGRLRTLVEETREAGQPVEFTEEGAPAEANGSADLVAYRVVQEALTNALKYAHGSRTSVLVQHGAKEITVEVSNEEQVAARGARPGFAAGSGRGLAGLRERVTVLGGDFSAGRATGGGFVVRARIPEGSVS